MAWLFLAILLAVPQTSPPVQEKAAYDAPHGRRDAQDQGETGKTPTTAPKSLINTEATSRNQNTDEATAVDHEQSVKISDFPPVVIPKNWTDYTYWFFSFCLVVVGGLQIWLLWWTLGAIRRQADIMDGQLAIPHRAYLAIGEPEKPIGSEARFPIENYGHIAARVTSVCVEMIIQRTADGQELYRRDIRKNTNDVIIPGKASAFALSIYLPTQAEKGDIQVLISGDIDYDTGFKTTDTLQFVRVYLRNASTWARASWGVEIDFREKENNST